MKVYEEKIQIEMKHKKERTNHMKKLVKLIMCFSLCATMIPAMPLTTHASQQPTDIYQHTTKENDLSKLLYEPKQGEDLTTFHETPLYDMSTNQLLLPRVSGYTTTIYGSDRKAVISLDGQVERGLSTQIVSLLYTLTNKETKEVIHTTVEAQVTIPGRELSFQGTNEMPNVMPQLREWAGGNGSVAITASSRIVYEDIALEKTAMTFQVDMKDLSGHTLQIIHGTINDVRAGDIYLDLDASTEILGDEGYYLEIGGRDTSADYVSVRSHAKTGVYYGTISIMQILKQEPTRSLLPKGIARDYPKYEERGMMLDVGRKYFTMEYLEDLTKQMSWYKMNFLSLHLSDNDIWNSLSLADGSAAPEGWFRLQSEAFPALTSEDHYTKEEFRNLQYLGLELGVEIVPELDTPGHALAYTNAWEGTQRDDNPKYLDVQKPVVLENVKTLFDEYILGYAGGEPTFIGDKVNIGTDEYKTSNQSYKEAFRAYTDALLKHIKARGKEPVFWGSLTENAGTTPVTTDAIMFAWFRGYANPNVALKEGYKIISMEDSEVYIVPGGGYYSNQFGQGQALYNRWLPNDNYGWRDGAVSKAHPNVLGGQFAVWNDFTGNGISMGDVNYRMKDNLLAIAEKTWAGSEGKESGKSWDEVTALGEALGDAPNADFLYDVEHDIQIVDHKIVEIIDGEHNATQANTGATIMKNMNVSVNSSSKDGAGLQFNGGTSYLQTDLTSLGFDWTTTFWIKPASDNTQRSVLMEGKTGKLVLNGKKISYEVEQYTHTFEYELDLTQWNHVALSGDYEGVALYVNGEHIDTLKNKPYPDYNCASGNNSWNGSYPSNGQCNTTRYYETLMLPMEYIGGTTDAFKGDIDNLMIYNRVLSEKEIKEIAGVSVLKNLALNKTVTTSTNETANLTGAKAVDGDRASNTSRWATLYTDDQWFKVDLGKVENVNNVKIFWEASYAREYKILVSEDDVTYIEVAHITDGVHENRDIKFNMTQARYVKFQGIKRQSDEYAYGYSFYEFEVYGDQIEGDVDIDPSKAYKNVALGKAASSTHHHNTIGVPDENEDRVASNATDGSLASRFEFDLNQGENKFTLTLNQDEDVNHVIFKEMTWGANSVTRISKVKITQEVNGVETDLLAEQAYGDWDRQVVFSGNKMTSIKEVTFTNSQKGATIHIYMTPKGTDANSLVNLSEIELYGSVEETGEMVDGQAIPHSQMKAFSSSENTFAAGIEGPAYLAIDDNSGTWWHTNYSPKEELPQSLTLDLQKEMTIGTYTYLPRSGPGNGTITKYQLQVSLDHTDYITIAEGNWALTNDVKTVTFDPVRARYVRLVALEGKEGYATAAEVNVHYAAMTQVDATYLRKAIEEAQALIDGTTIMTSSKAAMRQAVATAQSVIDDATSTQEDLDDAVSVLRLEMTKVVMRGDKAALQSYYDEVKTFFDALVKEDYVEVTYDALHTKLAEIKAVIDSTEEITMVDLNAKKASLQLAKDSLVNRSALKESIDQAKNLPTDFYTEATVVLLTEAIANAQTAYETATSTYAITSANYDLLDAMDDLVVDYTLLQEKIDGYQEALYTTSSWTAFHYVRNQANAVITNNSGAISAKAAYDALIEAEKALVEKGDATGLQALMDTYQAENLTEANYTPSTWNAYVEALAQANILIANKDDTTAEQFATALAALQTAHDALRFNQAEKAKLKEAIDSYDESLYTTSSWAVFKTTLEEAIALYENENAIQSEVDAMMTNLNNAAAVLVNRANPAPLHELLQSDAYTSLNPYAYTVESWNAFIVVKTEAEALLHDYSDQVDDDISAMILRLEAAKTALVDRPKVEADKTLLQEKVNAYHKEDYTASSWSAFTVYHDAVDALASNTILQEEIDTIVARFDTEASVLVLRGDVSLLQNLLESPDNRNLKESDYTTESWSVFIEVRIRAEALLSNAEDASQAAMDAIIGELDQAKNQLEKHPVIIVDKAVLQEKVNAYHKDEYTASSWKTFAVYEEALLALASNEVSQAEVDALVHRFDTEALVLVKRGDTKLLEEAVKQADAFVEDSYTKDSWTAFITTLDEVKEQLKNKEDLSQLDVDAQLTKLSKAMDGLVLVEKPTPDPKPEPTPDRIVLQDQHTNVMLEASAGVIPANTKLLIQSFTQNDEAHLLHNKVAGALGNAVAFTAFDIKLINDQIEIQPNGKVKITLDIPEGYDASYLRLYYIDDLSAKHEVLFRVENETQISFETDHFSIYALVNTKDEQGALTPEPKPEPTPAPIPVPNQKPIESKSEPTKTKTGQGGVNTGDSTNPFNSFLCIVLAGGAMEILRRHRKQKHIS